MRELFSHKQGHEDWPVEPRTDLPKDIRIGLANCIYWVYYGETWQYRRVKTLKDIIQIIFVSECVLTIQDAKRIDPKKVVFHITHNEPFNQVFDFIEHIYHYDEEKERLSDLSNCLNNMFEQRCSSYRIIEGLIVPIANKEEIVEIEKAIENKNEPVSIHISNALKLISSPDNPDYNGSIHESTMAVESMLACLYNEKQPNGFDDKLKGLEKKGFLLNPAFSTAFSKLFGYASSSSGTRHGGKTHFLNGLEEARLFLIMSSAFINYLYEKELKLK